MLGLCGLEGLQFIGFRAWGLKMGDFFPYSGEMH